MPAPGTAAAAPAGGFRTARRIRSQPDRSGAAGGLCLGQRAADGITPDEGADIAARAAHLAHAREDQRQGELDDLVAALKRLMIDSMGRQNDFAALRAIDMIARLRGLAPTTAKRSRGLDTALEEMRPQERGRRSDRRSRAGSRPRERRTLTWHSPGRGSGYGVRSADASGIAAAGRGLTGHRTSAAPSDSPSASARRRTGGEPRRRQTADLLLRTPLDPAPRAIRQD